MSLILEALKRSARERSAQETNMPGIFPGDSKPDNKHRQRLLKKIIFPLIILLNLAVLGYVLLIKQNIPDNNASPNTLPETPKNKGINTEQNKSFSRVRNTEPAPLVSQLPKVKVPAQKPLTQALTVTVKPKQATAPVQARLPSARTEPAENKNDTTSTEYVQESKNVLNTDNIKPIAELQDDNLANKLSGYEINTHIYSTNADRSFVLINMQKYRKGQTLSGSRFKIDSITPKGVVIDHGNGLVLLKAR